jgi:hypothetical protein
MRRAEVQQLEAAINKLCDNKETDDSSVLVSALHEEMWSAADAYTPYAVPRTPHPVHTEGKQRRGSGDGERVSRLSREKAAANTTHGTCPVVRKRNRGEA